MYLKINTQKVLTKICFFEDIFYLVMFSLKMIWVIFEHEILATTPLTFNGLVVEQLFIDCVFVFTCF